MLHPHKSRQRRYQFPYGGGIHSRRIRRGRSYSYRQRGRYLLPTPERWPSASPPLYPSSTPLPFQRSLSTYSCRIRPIPCFSYLPRTQAHVGGRRSPNLPITTSHNQAALNRCDQAIGLVVEDATWTSNGLPLPKHTRPTRLHQITSRCKIIFATVVLYGHGASLIGASAKLATPVDRSSYLVRTIDKLLRLHTSFRNRLETQRADNTSQPTDPTDALILPISPPHSPL
jgi:hypothetical protein